MVITTNRNDLVKAATLILERNLTEDIDDQRPHWSDRTFRPFAVLPWEGVCRQGLHLQSYSNQSRSGSEGKWEEEKSNFDVVELRLR